MTRARAKAILIFWGGSAALLCLCVFAYTIPLIWWIVDSLSGGCVSIPPDLAIGPLLRRTFSVSIISGFAAVVLAYPVALIWRLSAVGVQRVLVGLVILPLVMGLLSRNFSWVGMLSSNTPAGSLGLSVIGGTQLLYTEVSVYLVMTCVFLPVAFFVIVQGLRAVKPVQVEAARTLGLRDWAVVLWILLPRSYRQAALAFGLVLAMASGFFITPRMIGGGKFDFISNVILSYVNLGRFDYASTVAALFLAVMVVPTVPIVVVALWRRNLIMGR